MLGPLQHTQGLDAGYNGYTTSYVPTLGSSINECITQLQSFTVTTPWPKDPSPSIIPKAALDLKLPDVQYLL